MPVHDKPESRMVLPITTANLVVTWLNREMAEAAAEHAASNGNAATAAKLKERAHWYGVRLHEVYTVERKKRGVGA